MIKNKRFLLSALLLVFSLLTPAMAGATPQLVQTSLRLGRLGISATANNDLLVTFKLLTSAGTVNKIKVTFPTGFTITAGSPVVGNTFPNTPASITSPTGLPGTATATSSGAGLGGTILVSGLSSLTTGVVYGFTIATGTIQNPATAGQYLSSIESENSSGTALDVTPSVPMYIYGGGGGVTANADQVTVNASVAPNFSFSLSATSDTIPKVDPSAIQTSTGVNMTVSTNAPLGYTAYVKWANGALTSATNPSTPINTGSFNGSPDALTPVGTISKYTFVPSSGTVCVTTCSGSIAYDSEYNGITSTTGGSFNGSSFASFMSRSGYTGGDTILLQERVAVTATIGYANDYTDTLTIVAAGNF